MSDLLAKILPGNKTYIAAAGLAVVAFLTYQKGDVTGALGYLTQAAAILGLRVAISQAPKPADPVPVTPEDSK